MGMGMSKFTKQRLGAVTSKRHWAGPKHGCPGTIARDTQGNHEGAGKWLSNSMVRVLLWGRGLAAAVAAAAGCFLL